MLVLLVQIGLGQLRVLHHATMERSVKANGVVDVSTPAVMRRKLKPAVEPELRVILIIIGESRTDVDFADSDFPAILPPDFDGLAGIRKTLRLINDEERRAREPDITRMIEERNQALDEIDIVA